MMASDVHELIVLLPSDYRETLKPFLYALSQLASKRTKVVAFLMKLIRHRQSQTFPPPLTALKAPIWRPIKEFSEAMPDALLPARALHERYLTEALDAAIALKVREKEWLDIRLSGEAYLPPMLNAVKKVFDEIKNMYQAPVFSNDGVTVMGWLPLNGVLVHRD